MSIRYDGQVAIVTGSGGGLGRCHAIELAKRGAKKPVAKKSVTKAARKKTRPRAKESEQSGAKKIATAERRGGR